LLPERLFGGSTHHKGLELAPQLRQLVLHGLLLAAALALAPAIDLLLDLLNAPLVLGDCSAWEGQGARIKAVIGTRLPKPSGRSPMPTLELT